MPELFGSALQTPGLIWLVLTISIAGVVRGFTGFGTALVFVPVAARFLPMEQVVILITLTGVASAAALLPRAWREGDRREVGMLALAALTTVPLGLLILSKADAVTIRWIAAALAGLTLAALVSGWRYRGGVRGVGLLAIGAGAGLVGGMTGLTGPVVIIFYLAGQAAAQSVRANTILFLAALDVVIITNLFVQDAVAWSNFALAALLSIPYFLTSLIGQRLFDPRHEILYRRAAYTVIGLAVLSGLPLWD